MELDNVQNTASESAISSELETHQETDEANTPDTVPQGQEVTDEGTAQSGTESAESTAEQQTAEPFLTFKHNHENVSLNREQVIDAAQRGLKYGEISEKLDRIAAIKGITPTEFIDGVIAGERESYRKSIVDRLGEDNETVDRLMKLYDIEQGEKYNKAITDRQTAEKEREETLNSRLANEFTALKAEFSELQGYGDLPKEVRQSAEDGKDLMTAYLLHRHREEKAVTAAKVAAETAAKASAGSMSGEAENESLEIKNFIDGLYR